MNTTAQILGLTSYLAFLVVLYPFWRRYAKRLRSTIIQTTLVRRERIRELDRMHAHREAVRLGWHAGPTSEGGWR